MTVIALIFGGSLIATAAIIYITSHQKFDHDPEGPELSRRHTLTHDEIVHALRGDYAIEDARATHRNVYPLRARIQEREAQRLTRPHGHVENVVPFHPQDPQPPAAA